MLGLQAYHGIVGVDFSPFPPFHLSRALLMYQGVSRLIVSLCIKMTLASIVNLSA